MGTYVQDQNNDAKFRIFNSSTNHPQSFRTYQEAHSFLTAPVVAQTDTSHTFGLSNATLCYLTILPVLVQVQERQKTTLNPLEIRDEWVTRPAGSF